jgi:hypothetical protein
MNRMDFTTMYRWRCGGDVLIAQGLVVRVLRQQRIGLAGRHE